MSPSIQSLPKCEIPISALELFYRVTLWVEMAKHTKVSLLPWKNGVKKLNTLTFIKQGCNVSPVEIEASADTLCIPKNYSALNVLRTLRNAFCHGSLYYDVSTEKFKIRADKYVKIYGQFSQPAIEEFIKVFLDKIQ